MYRAPKPIIGGDFGSTSIVGSFSGDPTGRPLVNSTPIMGSSSCWFNELNSCRGYNMSTELWCRFRYLQAQLVDKLANRTSFGTHLVQRRFGFAS